jgi:hypothetical protein
MLMLSNSREDQPMRLTKTLGLAGALILSALVGGTLIGSALATDASPGTDSSGTAAASGYCDTYLDALASELGVSRDDLTAAGKAAATDVVDAAVAAGDLTEERATAIRERIDAADGDGCGWFGHGIGFARGFGKGFEHGVGRGFLGGDVFQAAADALGIDSADLIGRLRDAGSLQALAEAEGASYDEVKASILAAVQADLDAAVAEGLSQDRADAAIERLTTWLDNGGDVDGLRPDRGHGRFGRFGPWDAGSGGTESSPGA